MIEAMTEAELYAPIEWRDCSTGYEDILYHKSGDGIAKITINRPQVRNAFRPRTVKEMLQALADARYDDHIGTIILTGFGEKAFCAGGDQNVRGDGGYQDGTERAPKLRVLELQQQMRYCPKPIVAVVRGYAVGGGHILHLVSDLTLASESAVFGQTGPRMGSFDAGYGCVQAVATMGQKRARELWFLSRFYSAQEAKEMGMVNAVYGDDELDGRVAQWCRRMVMNSPTALAACKAACNAVSDGGAGILQMGGQLTRLFYLSDESKEGRVAFLEKRAPDFRSKL